jgi:hypothetical protein
MQPIFRVLLNQTEERRVARLEDVDCLCSYIAGLGAFWAHVFCEDKEQGGTLDIIVESDRATVDFLDIGRGVKLASRDETCRQRGFVKLKNDAYPELELLDIEVQHRDLISRTHAISILRHYLITGQAIDLVRWPPDDWDEWGDSDVVPDPPGEEIPF